MNAALPDFSHQTTEPPLRALADQMGLIMTSRIPPRHSLARHLATRITLGLALYLFVASAAILTFVYFTRRTDLVNNAREAGEALLASVAQEDWIPATEIRSFFKLLPAATKPADQRSRQFTLIDTQWQVIASTDPLRAWAIAGGLRQTAETAFADGQAHSGRYAGDDWLILPVHGENGAVRGILIVQVFRPETDAVFGSELVLLAALSAGLLVVSLGFGIRDARHFILRPLAALSAAARTVRSGNLEHRIQISSGDEFQSVAEAFNEMSTALAAHIRRQTALVKLSAELSATLDEQEVCERAVNTLADVVGYSDTGLYLRGTLPTERILRAARGIVQTPGFVIPPGEGLTELPMLDGQLHYTPDVNAEARYLFGASGTQSEVDVPLKVGDDVIGVLAVERGSPGGFDGDDFTVLTAAANQIALALSNARQVAEAHRRADELDALRATVADVLAERELPNLLRAILKRAVTLLNATGGDIGLHDAARNDLEIAASFNLGHDYTGVRMAPGEGVMGRIIETCEPLIIENYDRWAGRSPQYVGGQWRTAMGTPLMAGGRLVGAIGIVDAAPHRRFGPSDLRLLNLFAQPAAIAIENARLYAAEQRRAAQMAGLNEIARIIGSTIEIEQVLEQVGDALRRVIPADTYYVSTLSPDGETHTIHYLYDDGERHPPQTIGIGRGLLHWVITHRRPLRLGHVSDEIAALGVQAYTVGKDRPSASWMGAPLEAGGHMVGLMAVGSYRLDAFSESDFDILQHIARHAALAIDNARHHAEVEEQSRRDSLTQVYNHGYFVRRLTEETARSQETGESLALIMLDIDYFKQYNDTYGHATGDEVLHLTVQAIQAHVKRTDPVGRWGGEEFAIALPNTDLSQARAVAQRIRATLARLPLTDRQGRPIPLPTVSQGIAICPAEAEEAMRLVDVADARLYRAKERGRDQIESA